MIFLATVLFAAITLVAISVQKTYSHLPPKEVKRRARQGDAIAVAMYRVVGYGASLTTLLWIVVGVGATGLFVAMDDWLPRPLAIVGIVSVIWFGFAWLPNSRVTAVGQRLAQALAPAIAWLLNYLHPVFDSLAHHTKRQASRLAHTRLYQREDFLELLEQQQKQPDNRITSEELDIAAHALTFGDKLVRNILTPRSQLATANATDAIGPILIDELHKSGHSRFPVFDGESKVAGVLYLRDLVRKHQAATVAEAMRKQVYYLHEEQNLFAALQAFLKTKHHLFMVVNSFEEIVGIVTIEDVLEQIIGKPIMDEFDQYEDLRAVAAVHAAKIHKDQKHEEVAPTPKEPESSAEPPEVVE
jgi:CBS domain containing-hemolysin-like protein